LFICLFHTNINIGELKKILDARNEEASFISWVDKKKRDKVQKRLLVVGLNRISSFKPSMKVSNYETNISNKNNKAKIT
jgi:hypothetical protein